MSKATLKNVRVSPQKARLVANLIRGRDVEQALEVLAFTPKRTAPLVKKLIESAVANAEQKATLDGTTVDIDSLYVKTITVDMGPSLRRWRPRAMGRATKIIKPTSHIKVELAVREG